MQIHNVTSWFIGRFAYFWSFIYQESKLSNNHPCWVVGSGQKLAVNHKKGLLKWGIFIHERLKKLNPINVHFLCHSFDVEPRLFLEFESMLYSPRFSFLAKPTAHH